MAHFDGINDSLAQCHYCGLSLARDDMHDECIERLTAEVFGEETETAEDVEAAAMVAWQRRQEEDERRREWQARVQRGMRRTQQAIRERMRDAWTCCGQPVAQRGLDVVCTGACGRSSR